MRVKRVGGAADGGGMWLDLLGLGVLAAFMMMGLVRGTLASLMRILSLAGAYAVAIWAAPLLGPIAAERMALPDALGMVIAGSLAFAMSYVGFGVVSHVVGKLERKRRQSEDRHPLDHVGGALLGGVQGLCVMLLIGWLGLLVDAAQASGSLARIPETESSSLVRMTQAVVSSGAEALVDESKPGARVAVQMATRPRETMEGMQSVLANPRIQGLQSDALFWSYVENGAVDQALNQGSFLGIAYDDTLRGELAEIGLIPREAAEDPKLFRDEAREVLGEVGPRIKGLKTDPAVQQLLSDPEVVAALESGNHLALLGNPSFRALVSSVLEDEPSQN